MTHNFETPKSVSMDPSSILLYVLNLSIFIRINMFQRDHQWGHVWYHKHCEGLLHPNILPLLLWYFHILRYNASKRGVTFGTPCIYRKWRKKEITGHIHHRDRFKKNAQNSAPRFMCRFCIGLVMLVWTGMGRLCHKWNGMGEGWRHLNWTH